MTFLVIFPFFKNLYIVKNLHDMLVNAIATIKIKNINVNCKFVIC